MVLSRLQDRAVGTKVQLRRPTPRRPIIIRGNKAFSRPQTTASFWAHAASYAMGTVGSFPGGGVGVRKAAGYESDTHP